MDVFQPDGINRFYSGQKVKFTKRTSLLAAGESDQGARNAPPHLFTIGKVYEVLNVEGRCLRVTTDSGLPTVIFYDRFEPVDDCKETERFHRRCSNAFFKGIIREQRREIDRLKAVLAGLGYADA